MDEEQTTTEPRVWDDAYQQDVAVRVRAIRDELETVEGTAVVRRDLTTALRSLPA